MSQRIVVAMSVIMAIACLAVSSFAWQSIQDSQNLNQAMLEKLTLLSIPPATPKESPESDEYSPAKIKLVLGTPDGPPAEGIPVIITGNAYGRYEDKTGPRDEIRLLTDSQGIADFGQLRIGEYKIQVIMPWLAVYEGYSFVPRGQAHIEEIVCPTGLPEIGDVSIQIDWPEDLRDQPLLAVCGFSRQRYPVHKNAYSLGVMGVGQWTLQTSYPKDHQIILNTSGEMIETPIQANWNTTKLTPHIINNQHSSEHRTGNISTYNQLYFYKAEWQPQTGLSRFALDHYLTGFEIILLKNNEDSLLKKNLPVIAGYRFDYPEVIELASEAGVDIPTYQVKPDQQNHWKITLPEKLLKEVREKLKEQKQTAYAPNSAPSAISAVK